MPRCHPPSRAAVASCLALLLSACADGVPTVRELALEFDSAAIAHAEPQRSPFPDAARVRDETGDWYVFDIVGAGRSPEIGVARVTQFEPEFLPILTFRIAGERAPRLFGGDGEEFSFREWSTVDPLAAAPLADGEFTVCGPLLFVAGEPDEIGDRLAMHVPARRGARDVDRWRVVLGTLVADGFDLWPGETFAVHHDEGGSWRLDFVFATLAYLDDPAQGPARATWKLSLDGEPLARGEVVPEPRRVVWDSVSIDLGGRRGTLSFEADGHLARTAFLVPRLRRTDVRTRTRPDAAIFLADTFRADLVGFPTSAGSLTPNIDVFARDAVHFTHARSPSSWTLPAHASLFTTFQPTSHGAITPTTRLPADPVTLAGRMRDLGYRTVAVTNGGYVTRSFGMDRGFEWFFEYRDLTDLDGQIDVLERVLAHGDERPLFLFFQTYRAHEPYVASAAVRERYGDAIGFGREFHELIVHLAATGWRWGAEQRVLEGFDREIDELRSLYLGGAADLDAGFGRWLGVLAHHGRDSVVVFTSDHGESFGERDGRIGHHLGPWEDQARVPLIVRARGLAPAVLDSPATLMDVPRTLFALLDLPPHPSWEGRALLDAGAPLPAGTPLALLSGPEEVAWIEGTHKVLAFGPELDRRHVFDLREDPYELGPGAAHLCDWAEVRIGALLADFEWRVADFARESADVAPELAAQLRALGYAGDGS